MSTLMALWPSGQTWTSMHVMTGLPNSMYSIIRQENNFVILFVCSMVAVILLLPTLCK